MCLLSYKSIRILTNRKKSIKFQVFDEVIDDVLDDKVNRLRFYNEKFVKLKC